MKTKDPIEKDCPEGGTPAIKKRCRETSTKKIFEAGLKVFSQYGYDGATTKLVAKEAGMNESLINRYFEGKPGLLIAITRAFLDIESNSGLAGPYPSGETLEEELRNFFKKMFEYYVRVQPFLRVAFSRAITDPKLNQELAKNLRRGAKTHLLERIRFFQKKGIVRPELDPEKICFTISQAGFSMSFLGHVIIGNDREFVLSALGDFAKAYAAGISA